MWALLLGCVFIDDDEHAAFVATLADGPGDTDDTDDTGDVGDTGLVSGLVEAVAAGVSRGEEESRFGNVLVAGDLSGRGPGAIASTSGRRDGEQAFAWDPTLAQVGAVTILGDPDVAQTASRALLSVDSLVVAEDAGSGDAYLVVGHSGLRLEAWELHAAGEGSSLGTLKGEGTADGFGAALVSAGSATAVSAPGTGCGAVYVVSWDFEGESETDVTTRFQDGGRKLVPSGECGAVSSQFGAGLAFGDFADGGALGLAISAPGAEGEGGKERAGRVWILLDTMGAAHEGGLVYVEDAAIALWGQNAGAAYGTALAVFDANGDGHDDLAVSAPAVDDGYDDSGQVYIYLDVATMSSGVADADAAIVLRAATDGARFGAALSSVGGEGSWLAVGAPGWSDASGEGGAVLLFEGDGLTSDTAFDHVRRLQGARADDEIGTRLVPAPDSLGGLLIGAPGASVEDAAEAGVVWWWR